MNRVLIIDDDAIRVPAITAYAEGVFQSSVEVVHSETFVVNWDDFDMIFLDHDLGPGGDVSDHVRRIFPEGYKGTAHICVHSMNPVGAQNIINSLGRGVHRPYSLILGMHREGIF